MVKHLTNVLASKKVSTRPRPRQTQRRNAGVDYAEIPVNLAYSVKQNVSQPIQRLKAREAIGSFAIGPMTVIGATTNFMMNPILLQDSRLARIASVYQKFRFRNLAITVQSSATTATGGLMVLGYCSNPDFEITPNRDSSWKAVMDFPGAQSTNLWRTVTSVAKLQDKNKWYNVDADSAEIMQTTQGYFAISVQSPSTTTAPISMPVWLDYEVEFTGAAIAQAPSQTFANWPEGTFSYSSITGNYTFSRVAGETLPIPSTTNGVAYIVNPTWPCAVTNGTETFEEDITVMVPTALSYNFYRTLDDVETNNNFKIPNDVYVMRSTITVAHPN